MTSPGDAMLIGVALHPASSGDREHAGVQRAMRGVCFAGGRPTQAAHILEDRDPRGVAAVVNGIALCAIHHLAYDRNLMGIDARGGGHVSDRLLREHDGPMLRSGLQGFHSAAILQPRRPAERPDPNRLEVRFERFLAKAA
jgi:putative restriction endonuclease